MRIIAAMTAARTIIAGVLCAGPAVMAFLSGGYFDRPRLWAGVAAWACVLLSVLFGGRPWPRTREAGLALGGLVVLAAWTILSIRWAPLRGPAQADAQRTVLYLGVALAGTGVFVARRSVRAVEPILAFGAATVMVEGLSERLVPGIFTLAQDASSMGRLSQPVTYWNAMGIIAAMAFVLLVRIAGDPTRSARLRLAALAAGPAVALGVYLTLSRGALLCATIGLVVLVRLIPTREQLRAAALMLIIAAPPIVVAVASSAVRTLHGTLGSRERAGIILLGAILASMIAAVSVGEAVRRRRGLEVPAESHDTLIRRGAGGACLLVAVITAGLFVTAAASRVNVSLVQASQATSARLVTTDTIRGNFWSVAATAFVHHPVRGVGAGGFETEWERHRALLYYARDAHSLYLETLSELGVVGGLALVGFLVGVGLCARRAYRLDPGLCAGWIAVLSMVAVHAGLDWDWEMPAVALFAFVVVGAVLACSEAGRDLARSTSSVVCTDDAAPIASAVTA